MHPPRAEGSRGGDGDDWGDGDWNGDEAMNDTTRVYVDSVWAALTKKIHAVQAGVDSLAARPSDLSDAIGVLGIVSSILAVTMGAFAVLVTFGGLFLAYGVRKWRAARAEVESLQERAEGNVQDMESRLALMERYEERARDITDRMNLNLQRVESETEQQESPGRTASLVIPGFEGTSFRTNRASTVTVWVTATGLQGATGCSIVLSHSAQWEFVSDRSLGPFPLALPELVEPGRVSISVGSFQPSPIDESPILEVVFRAIDNRPAALLQLISCTIARSTTDSGDARIIQDTLSIKIEEGTATTDQDAPQT